MSIEMTLALCALAAAIVALGMLQAQGKTLADAAAKAQQQMELLEHKLVVRLREALPHLGGDDADADAGEGTGEQIPRLIARIQALELKLSERDALLCSLVSEDEARHLWNISQGHSTTYELHPGVEGELRSMVRRGFVSKKGEFNIHELAQHFDLCAHFELTTTGESVLALRQHLRLSDSRGANSLPPRAPESRELASTPPPFSRPQKSSIAS